MPLTPADVSLLAVLARYYVLTREQIQSLCFPDHRSGRSTRKRLTKLRHEGAISKHRLALAVRRNDSAAPVYYLTKTGAELLASFYDDDAYLAANTRAPRADRLAHWIAVNDTRMIVERAIAAQNTVTLDGWINEWETVNKDAHLQQQFSLHTQLNEHPPLSCSPDAAFLLSLHGHRKVFYLEQDLGTSSPRQIAVRKTKGYAELAARAGHRRHFPETTLDRFSVLFVTTTAYRCRQAAREVSRRKRPDLWLFLDRHELTPAAFLSDPVVYDHQGKRGPLVKLSQEPLPPAEPNRETPS